MQPFDSGLAVELQVTGRAVTDVRIHSTRLVQASRMLASRTPAQVTAILPAIYALCGTAQALAGCGAMEAALRLNPSPAHRMARHFLLWVETVTEHAQGILRDWPGLVNEPPDLDPIKPLRPMVTAAKRALYPDGDWARPGGGRLAIDHGALIEQRRLLANLAAHLFDGSPEDWVKDPDSLQAWARRGEGIAARLLHRVERDGLSAFGRATPHLMRAEGPRDLETRLADDDSGDYVAHPDCGGAVFETNALSRQSAQPLIAALIDRHGTGITARLTARLVEIAVALRDMEDLAQDLCDAPRDPAEHHGSGNGLGVEDAARGLLAHRVEIEEGVVNRYQILAPTEWNFHPAGPLFSGLMGAEATPDLKWRAHLLVAALDPCVACTVEVHHA
ncbi:MAG: nickel-dependent hydrogenase large subunit [Phaeospirillum sp.]|nr:nickel-dependent hydrogenase large subunit [Phaeospirillum sp.]